MDYAMIAFVIPLDEGRYCLLLPQPGQNLISYLS